MENIIASSMENHILYYARVLKSKNPDLTMQECILVVIAYELNRIERKI